MFGIGVSRRAAKIFVAVWIFGPTLGAAVGPASAQDYPSRPVKVIVPTPPGGPVDVVGRLSAN
jgi:tripartite-type tricarboxylate transporter receptor subunit TctC